MSNSSRDRGRFGDRFKNKSGEEILQNLREQLDQDKKMFFDSTPAWGESASTKSPFSRPGFPFDDPEDSRLPRSSRLQKHLDELANRHPEFADHLRPDVSGNFRTWGPRNRRSSGGSGGTGVFSSEDEASDNRSQASGGSEMSGGVPASEQTTPAPEEGPRGFNKLPQYGLRNTVDLGGAAQKLQESERNQRSWSAPPDARSTEPGQPKRFVSRIEIQPKIPGAQSTAQPTQPQPASPPVYSSSPGKPPMAPKPPTNKQGGNVRHIPIFVEGRDEPVLAKDATDAPKPTPPSREDHFPSHADHFQSDFPSNSHFSDPFSDHPFGDRFSRPQFANAFQQNYGPQQHSFRSQPQSQGFHPQQQPQAQQQPVPPQKRPTASQAPPTKRPTDNPAPSAPTPPPPAPPVNDPLVKVAAVQSNVDALVEQVTQFSGSSRKDKQYIYLDEMLTRNLLQLDDIETQGKENIRQARKDTIRSIQRAISLLESKAPTNDTSKTEDVTMEVTEGEINAEETDSKSDVRVEEGGQSEDTAPTKVKTEEAMEVQAEGVNIKEGTPAVVEPKSEATPQEATAETTSDTSTSDNATAVSEETKPAESVPVET